MDIYTASKAGDLQRIKYLVEIEDVDINETNEFDAIPLFYACLCGHQELVEYYLEQGAVLDANTFEGWRCYYAALTPEIHQILRNYKAKPRDLNRFIENMRSLFEECNRPTSAEGSPDYTFPDTTFIVEGRPIHAHRFLLAANSSFFAEMFLTRWKDKRVIPIKAKRKNTEQASSNDINDLLKYEAFEALLLYFYTNSVNLAMEYVDSLILLCKQCKLTSLAQKIEGELGWRDFMNPIRDSKRKQKKRLVITPSAEEELEAVKNLRKVAKKIVLGRQKLSDGEDINNAKPVIPLEKVFADVTLRVKHDIIHDEQGNAVVNENPEIFEYVCHRGLLCYRSEYFRPLLGGNFRETSSDMITFSSSTSFSPAVFDQLIEFLYTNNVHNIYETETVLDLLGASNQLLLPDLKKLCVSAIISHVDLSNVYDLLNTSEFFDSYRLREYCLNYVSKNIDDIWETPELYKFVKSASPEMVQMLKEAIEEHLVHYGQKQRWLHIEEIWDRVFA